MYLPDHIRACIDALEDAGFAAYAVGGCVRDALLGLTPHDYDLCTSARPDEIRRVFAAFRLVLAGEKHGTVSVIMGKEPVEITTFRTEGGYEDSRHPDWVRFVDAIEEDLSRRDFTVNAMAYSPTRGFADPFGGQEDLNRKILRAVGDPETRFTEDAHRRTGPGADAAHPAGRAFLRSLRPEARKRHRRCHAAPGAPAGQSCPGTHL